MNIDSGNISTGFSGLLSRDLYRERMFLKGLIMVCTAWFLGAFLWVALQRMGYPYELEIHEGSALEAALRLLAGKSLYEKPSLEWAPLIHTPLYYYISAGLMNIFGNTLTILRIVTSAATIGTGVIFYRFLRHTGVEDFFALAGFGVFFAVYNATGSGYDLARIEMLAIFLAIASVFFAAYGSGWFRVVLSALLIALAVFTLQCYLIIWLLLLIRWFRYRRKSFYLFAGVSVFCLAVGLIFLHYQSGGQIWRFVFLESLKGKFYFSRIITFWFLDLFWKFPLLSVLGVVGLFGLGRIFYLKKTTPSDSAMAILVLGFMLITLLHRMQSNELDFILLPAVIALAGLAAWALQHFHINEYGFGWLPAVTVKILLIIQFAFLLYNPKPLIPDSKDLSAGRKLIETISAMEGEVLIPKHPYYNRLGGKQTHFDANNLVRIIGDNGGFRGYLPSDIAEAISTRKFSHIIIDEPLDAWIDVIAPYYLRSDTIFRDPEEFMPVIGIKSRPQYIYISQ